MERRPAQRQSEEENQNPGRVEVEAFAPKIISASRRTDIPAFFSDKFIENWRKGYFKSQNRFGQTEYMAVENARCVVFWTKNPAPLMNRLDDFEQFGVNYYFHFTLNDYEQEGLEPNVPPLKDRIATFIRLSERIGKERVIWRFDPLVLTERISKERLVEKVFTLAEQVAGHTENLVVSFLDLDKYKNNKKRLKRAGFRDFSHDEIKFVASHLAEISERFGIRVATCRENDLSEYGIAKNKCIDDDLMRRVFSEDVPLMNFLAGGNNLKDPGQPKSCGCIVSKDIGSYDTCRHLCTYCYAISSKKAIKSVPRNAETHSSTRTDRKLKAVAIHKKANDFFIPGGGQLIRGDCYKFLPTMPGNVIDLIVTDPPYGYEFMGKDWDKAIPSVEIWKECFRVLKPGAFAFIMSAPRQDLLARMIGVLQEAGFETNFTSLYWAYANGFSKRYNVSKAMDKRAGAQGEVVSEYELPDMRGDNYGQGKRKYSTATYKKTKPATEQAKEFEGAYSGYQPKPAVEVILVVKKPNSEKTSIDQALANGKGVTWLDDCRIPYANGSEAQQARNVFNEEGRVPANLLVSDNVLDGYLPGQAEMGEQVNIDDKTSVIIGRTDGKGAFSRYFALEPWIEKKLPYLIIPKASKSERNAGLGILEWDPKENTHPTVKPVKLMAYLIALGSREGDIVLDPFCGSGSTCMAALQMNRKALGIEKEDEYIQIAHARYRNLLLELDYGITAKKSQNS